MSTASVGALRVGGANRWWQLALGILAMVMIANLQYGWTLFVNPMREQRGWELSALQWTFTLFVLVETWLVPVEAYLVDRFGPRPLVAAGGVMVAIAWVGASLATSLTTLYIVYGVIGGIGAGIVYGTSVGNALKWFPDRRGLCAGLTAAGFGGGAALTVAPISQMIQTQGYQAAFFWFGLVQGAVVVVAALFLSAPRKGWQPAGWDPAQAAQRVRRGRGDLSPLQMLRTPHFWLLYVMFTMVATGGLMATAQLGPIARDFGVEKVLVFGTPALTLALQLDRILNGITRPFWGWVSDHIGRELSMFLAFGSEAVAITCLLAFAHDPVLFVVFSGLAFFSWGEIYSLFPATSGDLFGQKFATTNYGILYTAKGTASILAGYLAARVVEIVGSWAPVFFVVIAFDVCAALLALLVLRRMTPPTPELADVEADAPTSTSTPTLSAAE